MRLQIFQQQFLHPCRIAFPLSGLHALAGQVTESVGFAVFIVLNGLLVGLADLVHHRLQGGIIGDLC